MGGGLQPVIMLSNALGIGASAVSICTVVPKKTERSKKNC